MAEPGAVPPAPVSTGLMVVGSLLIGLHLAVLGISVLAAPSGPWGMGSDNGMAPPPRFAFLIDRVTAPTYLNLLRMTHNYHFATNRPGAPGVYCELRLKDEEGKVLTTLKLPEDNANAWVRHRQELLVRGLTEDVPVPAPQGESVAAPNQQLRSVEFWEMGEGRILQISKKPEHLVPRDRPVFRPSEWSLLLAQSYGRYLCRTHGAAKVELLRHTRDPIPPTILSGSGMPSEAFDDLIANFGEFSR